jgi:hypothetical protein
MDFSQVHEAEVAEFLARARKGLRYGEDIFLGIYAFQEEKEPLDVLWGFFENVLRFEEDRRPYGKFLIKKGILADFRTRITMPGFLDDFRETTKEATYRMLALHIPSSDMFELIGADLYTKMLYYKLPRMEGQFLPSPESGNTIFLFINQRKELSVLHTIFT